MTRALFALGALLAAGCSGAAAYGRVWITNADASQPASLLAQFGGPGPVNATTSPVYGACFGTTRNSEMHYASAGTLTLSGTGGPLQLAPDSTNTYRAEPSVTWTPGTSLTIVASGRDVPPFSGTFIVPPPLAFTNFTRRDLLAAIQANDDVVLRWDPLAAEHVWVGVVSGSAEVSCTFKGQDGSGTIPGAALATLPAARTINSSANNSSQLQLENWHINLIAQSARAQLADGSTL